MLYTAFISPRRILPLLIAIGLFGSMNIVQAQDWTAARLHQMYVEFLESQGLSPVIDRDGDVQFRQNDLTYFIDVEENDTEYFAVMLAQIYAVDDDNRLQVLEACNGVTASAKVVKGQVINDYVWLTCEVFIKKPQDFQSIFDRVMEAMEAAQVTFIQGLDDD